MKITALLENTTEREDLQAEHGLSLYIQTNSRKILFDMGQTDAFQKNAQKLGVSLKDVDVAVLSHGHYDHGGGLSAFLASNDKATVYVQKDAFLPHYNGVEKYIGLDAKLALNPQITFTNDEYAIADGVTVYSCNQNTRKAEEIFSGLTEKVGERFVPDDFRHEQYLLLTENGKRVLISGCSHKGILDIVEWFHPDVFVGGFHLSKLALDDRLENIVKALSAYPTKFYTCHCTGKAQFSFMRTRMPNLEYLYCGKTIEI